MGWSKGFKGSGRRYDEMGSLSHIRYCSSYCVRGLELTLSYPVSWQTCSTRAGKSYMASSRIVQSAESASSTLSTENCVPWSKPSD